jgi:hypothetical protein
VKIEKITWEYAFHPQRGFKEKRPGDKPKEAPFTSRLGRFYQVHGILIIILSLVVFVLIYAMLLHFNLL